MKNRYPVGHLGEVLTLALDQHEVQNSSQYAIAGVYGFGRGIFAREPIMGTETKYARLNRLQAGMLVLSRLKAFEGALAVIPDEFDGFFLSSEFPTFSINQNKADTSYIKHLCAWPGLWSELRRGSKGIGARRERVNADKLLATEVPLPDLDEQRRVATKLDKVLRKVDDSWHEPDRSNLSTAMFESVIDEVLGVAQADRSEFVRLGDVARINPRPSRLAAEEVVAFVPMAKVDDRSGVIKYSECKTAETVGKGYKQFIPEDVIFARIAPCMQNGKSAIFKDSLASVGLGSTEFHVVRSDGSVSPEWIHAVLRSRTFREEAGKNMSGTAGQQRVPAAFLEHAWVPLPGDKNEEEKVLQKVSNLNQKKLKVQALHHEQKEHLKALRASLLKAAFTGQL